MVSFIQAFHSGWRWIVVLLLIVILVKYLIGFLTKADYAPLDKKLSMWFAMSYLVQIVLGIVLLITRGEYAAYQFEHLAVLFLPLFLAGLPARWKTADSVTRFRNGFLVYLAMIALVYLGVARVGGW